MSVIFILLSASLLVATGFLISFLWAVRNGQYEDDYTPSVRILYDNDLTDHNTSAKTESVEINLNSEQTTVIKDQV